MLHCVFLLSLISNLIYFSIIAILGIQYNAGESLHYQLFCVFFSGISIILSVYYNFVKGRFHCSRYEFVFFIILLFFLLIIFFENPQNEIAYDIYKRYILWPVPAIFIGFYYARRPYELIDSLKYWYIAMIIMSIGSFLNVYDSLTNMSNLSETLAERYQTISYTASLSYAINLLCCLFKPNIGIKKRYLYIISIFCFILQILSVFVSGGRGGFVVIFLSTLLYLIIGVKYYSFNKLKVFNGIMVCVAIILISLPFLISNPIIERGIQRVFSYISADGIDMSETSNRDVVYTYALGQINESPLFGHGIYKQLDSGWYPHNIFLEVLVGGGFSYFFVFILLSLFYVKRLVFFIRKRVIPLIILPIAIYVFVFLMLSGTYLETAFFWFTASFIMCTNNHNISEKNINK